MLKLPTLQPGYYYHVYNRGNNRDNIFFEERNYRYFLDLYLKHVAPAADTFAYCLMPNHFHLLTQIKLPERSTGGVANALPTRRKGDAAQHFSNFFNAYAKAINKAYGRTGALFQHRYGRIVIDSDRYFLALVSYIHRNPEKHGFTPDFRTYAHSSYQTMLSNRPTHLQRQAVLNWFGSTASFAEFHQREAPTTTIAHLVDEAEQE
jgi:putative transposase